MIAKLFEFIFGSVAFGAMLLFMIGWFYWLWIAIQVESFTMFLLPLLFPPAFLVTAPTGAYALFYGMPEWVANYII